MRERVNFRKLANTSIIINTVQIAMILSILIYIYINGRLSGFTSDLGETMVILYLVILILVLNSIFTIKYAAQMIKKGSQYLMLAETNSQLEKLNNTLRFQRHDFMNHLQVVYSLLEMDEYNEAKDYIEKVFNDIQKVNKILKTSNAAVNALLQAKIINAEKAEIDTKINITTQLSDLSMPSWEFCRILGNLMDNSIYALLEVEGERFVQVELSEDLKRYGFRVTNNGPDIPKEVIDKIFTPGFTTKGEKGEGMGLAITKALVEQYKGEILVHSKNRKTVFEGWIPKSS